MVSPRSRRRGEIRGEVSWPAKGQCLVEDTNDLSVYFIGASRLDAYHELPECAEEVVVFFPALITECFETVVNDIRNVIIVCPRIAFVGQMRDFPRNEIGYQISQTDADAS